MLPRSELERYDAAVEAAASAAAEAVRGRVGEFLARFPGASAAEAREFAVECACGAAEAYGDAAAAAAADLYDALALAAGRRLPPAAIDASDASPHVEKEVRYQVTKLLDGRAAEFAERCGAAARGQVPRRANATMASNAERDGVRWARVPMGCGCTFCAMLASRGFVYRSARSAGEGAHYHDRCRCKAVPDFGGVEGYDPDEWAARWRQMEEIDADAGLSSAEKRDAKAAVGRGMSYADLKEAEARASVDMDRVKSRAYARIYEEALEGARMAGEVAADARRMLAHRDGSLREDLYAYDLTAGRRIGSSTNGREVQAARPTEAMRKGVERARAHGHAVFTLHNHPHSGIPSFADIRSQAATGCAFDLIACHDGSVYKYSIVGKPMPGYTLDAKTFEASYEMRVLAGKSEKQIFEAMEMELGVRIERFI